MSTPTIKLTYFAFPGRAGPIRDVLTKGGIAFEDAHVSKEDFPTAREEYPYKSVPVLHVDDAVYAQSNAILRYAGKLTGMYPEDPVKAMFVDEIMDTVEDFIGMLSPSMKEEDEEKKLAMRAALMDGPLPAKIAQLEARYLVNEGAYLLGDDVTVADYKVFHILAAIAAGFLDGIPADIVSADSTPGLHAAFAAISAEKSA